MKIDINTLRRTKGIGSKTLERIIEQHNLDNNIKSFKSEYIPSDTYKINQDINLWQEDCLELMSHIPDKSVDMVLCDLPYGITECSWDEVIPFEPLWSHYKRVIKDNGVVVLFSSQPFTNDILNSNKTMNFLYEWIWLKRKPIGFANANHRPMKIHENILVFSPSTASSGSLNPSNYNPQGLIKVEDNRITKRTKRGFQGERENQVDEYTPKYTNYPTSILCFSNIIKNSTHPTQKPVELLEYLIKTYTNKGMVVLDNTMGSGSTGVACKNTNRKFIGIELDEEYFNIAKERIENIE